MSSSSGRFRINRLQQSIHPASVSRIHLNTGATHLDRSSSTSSLVASLYEKLWTGSADDISGDDDDDEAMPQKRK